ncbi:MAG: hypothetical protein ACXAC5_03030 [Promethearchaeota archaeon]|jgi:hypothetical protein
MTKQQFAEVFLSRYHALSDAGKHQFLCQLFVADEKLRTTSYVLEKLKDSKRLEETEEFEGWANCFSEILFPEQLGDLIIGPLGVDES